MLVLLVLIKQCVQISSTVKTSDCFVNVEEQLRKENVPEGNVDVHRLE